MLLLGKEKYQQQHEIEVFQKQNKNFENHKELFKNKQKQDRPH